MGFGHRIYKNGDPRSDIIKAYSKKLSEKKSTRHIRKRIFSVDKILSVNIRQCKYVGGENTEIKQHLYVKFTSHEEEGNICMSVLLDNYSNLL